ncbi:MAG: GTPase Era [Candidatus Gastranaerophilales bacterium]|nr:GTPase Era [Candidatus Gastranaerophilales bacterium]
MAFKSGFVTILGRTNVGKSTLLNKIIGQKIVITSDKPQTTRQRLKGVYTDENGQIVFIDTPGVHKPKYKLGEYLADEIKNAAAECDVTVLLTDGSVPPGSGDRWIIDNLLNKNTKIILVINKLDLIKDEQKKKENIAAYKVLLAGFDPVAVNISAKTGKNVDNLIKNIIRQLPKGPKYYDDDMVTDQNIRLIAQEIIREKILLLTQDEVPHSCAVVIEKFEETPKITKIQASIHVEHDSQKGIIIGKNGAMLKKIGTKAREEIEALVENKVFLELFVKVTDKWRKKTNSLKAFGYALEN